MNRLIPLCLLVLMPALGCTRDKSNPAPPAPPAAGSGGADPTTLTYAPALGVNLAEATKLPSGVYIKDQVVGAGPAVAEGQQIAVHYTGWLPDGTRFDGNEGGDPYSFRLGAHEVIPGWEQGVAGMHVGGKRQLIIPPALGYGAGGNGPIPPNAVLVFTVEVVSATP
jgi:FKBP-type peptidyl-prolyl cis-trans isomerase FkpA